MNANYNCPICPLCGGEPKYFITRRSNRNGNAKRPYYKCLECNKFVTFADERGINANNPVCDCDHPSRMQVAGKSSATPRGLHYVCVVGRCDFFERAKSPAGKQYKLDESLVDMFSCLGII